MQFYEKRNRIFGTHYADFLSRIEINNLDSDEIRFYLAAIHSGIENLDDHIYITETPLNYYIQKSACFRKTYFKCLY